MRIAVVGAGWAGLAAAVCAVQAGHSVTVWEASRTLGGRARALSVELPDGSQATLDNGQHILIGAYTECLRLMRLVGVDTGRNLLRLPFTLRFPDNTGLLFPFWPTPLDALAGIVGARGWSLSDKATLARHAVSWQLAGFRCPSDRSVAQLCRGLSGRVMAELVEPLCVSALNTTSQFSSAQVFLRVLRDAVFGAGGSSNLLLPRVNLSALFPDPAAKWLERRGATVHVGVRVRRLHDDGARWCIDGAPFDRVVLATAARDTLRILDASLDARLPASGESTQMAIRQWSSITRSLQHKAITTVYAWGRDAALAHPMLALRSGGSAPPTQASPGPPRGCSRSWGGPANDLRDGQSPPAQFVFDRGQLGGPRGLLAFVISASEGERERNQAQVLAQAHDQLGLTLLPVQTVVEKHATLACTPGLRRPPGFIAAGLQACADYVDGPYPSTLEGAVRAAVAAIRSPDSAS